MAIVDELIAVLGFDLRGEGELRKFEQGLDRAEKGAKGFASAFIAIGGAVAGALAGLQIGRMAGDFVGSIASVNAEFESYQATLETITGSSEKAKAALDWVTEFGRTTPYEVSEVTDAFVRLKSYGIDPTNGTLRAIGDASSAMGKGLMQGVEAVADAATGEFERLKEFGVRASVAGDQVTFAWTENGKTIEKTVKKQGDEITAFMLENFGRFNGAMDKQSKTWKGMTSNLADNWTGFLREIGEAGYYDDIKRRLTGVLSTVDMWREDGTFKRLAKGISDGLVGALNTASHLAMQAYRIGRGFYYAADGVVSLIARVNGLGKTATAIGLGAGLLASSALGRRAMLAVARKIPMVAALLVFDDIVSGLNGDNSVVGSLEGGQKALDNINASLSEIVGGATELADALNGVFGINQLVGENPLDAFMRSFKGFASNEVVGFLNEVADAIRDVTAGMKAIAGVLNDPEAAWTRFADAAIAQIDRIVAAVDEKLGGALTKFGFIGAEPKAVDAPKRPISTTGSAPQAPRPKVTYEPDAQLSLEGMQVAEGLKSEKGVSTESLTNVASTIANIISTVTSIISTVTSIPAMAKLGLDITGFTSQANSALSIQADLARGVSAVATLNIDQFMAQAARAKAELQSLQAMSVGRGSSGTVPPRAQSVAAPTP